MGVQKTSPPPATRCAQTFLPAPKEIRNFAPLKQQYIYTSLCTADGTLFDHPKYTKWNYSIKNAKVPGHEHGKQRPTNTKSCRSCQRRVEEGTTTVRSVGFAPFPRSGTLTVGVIPSENCAAETSPAILHSTGRPLREPMQWEGQTQYPSFITTLSPPRSPSRATAHRLSCTDEGGRGSAGQPGTPRAPRGRSSSITGSLSRNVGTWRSSSTKGWGVGTRRSSYCTTRFAIATCMISIAKLPPGHLERV